jgi:hypothetical protein
MNDAGDSCLGDISLFQRMRVDIEGFRDGVVAGSKIQSPSRIGWMRRVQRPLENTASRTIEMVHMMCRRLEGASQIVGCCALGVFRPCQKLVLGQAWSQPDRIYHVCVSFVLVLFLFEQVLLELDVTPSSKPASSNSAICMFFLSITPSSLRTNSQVRVATIVPVERSTRRVRDSCS